VKYDHKNVAKFLIERGANINTESSEGETPLMEAVVHNSYNCLMLFMNEKAHCRGKNKRGNTTLHLAALSGDLRMLQILNGKPKAVDIHAKISMG
jgi:uncharacterized protein